MEGIDHEAQTIFQKKTQHKKIRPATAQSRTRQNRSLE